MKRFITIALFTFVAVVSCKKFDDSKIWEELRDHENRIALLEELCKKLNSDIINLQTIVTALETNDYIINASPLATGDGYTFLFKSGKSIVVYNGKDGSNGSDGKDGVTPQIGVKKDSDGIYYWTINGEWLLVDGEKVKARAEDGNNGENGTNGVDGKDGVTPQLKIVEGYWYVSYNDGIDWIKVGKAVGDNGLNGANGDSFFKGVDMYDGFVVFRLNDGEDTIIKIPLQKDTVLEVTVDKAGTLRSFISSEGARVTTKLKVKGSLNNDDMKFIQHFTSLLELDLSESIVNGSDFPIGESRAFHLNPYREALVNRTLVKVWLPKLSESYVSYAYCSNLEYLIIPCQETYSWSGVLDNEDMSFCPMIQNIEYSEGVTTIPSDSKMKYFANATTYYYNANSKYSSMILPSTTTSVYGDFLRHDLTITNNKRIYNMYDYFVTCKAVIPPNVISTSDKNDYNYNNCTLYVPAESVDLYKEHLMWGKFNVLPIAE